MIAANGASAIHVGGLVGKVIVPGDHVADARVRRRGGRRSSHLRHRRPPAPRPRRARLPARPAAVRAGCWRWRTAPTTPRRRWASSRSRSSPTATSTPTSFACRTGSWSRRRRRSRSGTYTGGWRIIRTMGSRIIKMDPAQGFAAQSARRGVILAASHAGFPLSTTHVISGGVMGAGRGQAPVGRALGRRRQHGRRVGPDAAVRCRDRRRRVRRHGLFGSGATGPDRRQRVIILATAGLFARRLQGRGGLEAAT